MSRFRLVIALALAAAATATIVAAAPVSIKLATIAPAQSAWHKALLDMGDAWTKATEGRVDLKVYAGGTVGTEDTAIRKMRPGVDELQGGLFMSAGLAEIDDAFSVFGIPFFFQSDAEELDVQRKLAPVLTSRLEAKGFHLICWGNAGWVQLFSKKPLKTLAEVKAAKLYTLAGDPRMVTWYQANGFNPVALSTDQLAAQMKLPTGMIDTAPTPPYGALLLNLFTSAKYMLDVRVDPLVGAVVLSNDAWNKISADDHAKMMDAAKAFETRIYAEMPKQDAASVTTMVQRGLTVIKLAPKDEADFHAAAEKAGATMRGTLVPADIYDMAIQERDAFRKKK